MQHHSHLLGFIVANNAHMGKHFPLQDLPCILDTFFTSHTNCCTSLANVIQSNLQTIESQTRSPAMQVGHKTVYTLPNARMFGTSVMRACCVCNSAWLAASKATQPRLSLGWVDSMFAYTKTAHHILTLYVRSKYPCNYASSHIFCEQALITAPQSNCKTRKCASKPEFRPPESELAVTPQWTAARPPSSHCLQSCRQCVQGCLCR